MKFGRVSKPFFAIGANHTISIYPDIKTGGVSEKDSKENQRASSPTDSSKNSLLKAFLQNGKFFLHSRTCYTLIVLLFGLTLATPARAGFFSNLVKFFKGGTDIESQVSVVASVSLPLLGSQTSVNSVGGPVDELPLSLPATQDNALVSPKNPLGTLSNPHQDQILVYTVQPGDTPAQIAEDFGISLNTLLWANNIRNPNLIRVGDELIVLPVSGVQYEVKKGDTIESIALKFKGDTPDILNFNGLAVDEPLKVGTIIIIPDGEAVLSPSTSPTLVRSSGLPEHRGYYLRPILGGRKSRGLHGFNGIDLADSCGRPVLASAAGTILITRASGWNGGYGKYIVMTHPNGTQTLYAHLSSILGNVGQEVAQSSQIATIGSTGNSTGCHVHFEVRGARNPF